MKILSFISVAMIFFLSGWVWYTLSNNPIRTDDKLLLGIQAYYGSTQAFSEEEIQPYFDRAKERAKDRNWWGNFWKILAHLVSWLAFLAATIMTGVAAYFGKADIPPGQQPADTVTFLRKQAGRNAWAVGLLSAIIAVCTAVASRAESEASQGYKRADEIAQLIRNTRNSIYSDKPLKREEVQDLLDTMDRESQRL